MIPIDRRAKSSWLEKLEYCARSLRLRISWFARQENRRGLGLSRKRVTSKALPVAVFSCAVKRARTAKARGLNKRLARARQLYGQGWSLPFVVSGLYDKLDELRQLCGSESIEEILDVTIDLKRRLNRTAELQGKVVQRP